VTNIRPGGGCVSRDDPSAEAGAAFAPLGLLARPGDEWSPGELALPVGAMLDFLRVARWTPAACARALGGPIVVARERAGPIVTDDAGVRYPLLGLYDADRRVLTVNDWSFDARTGGEAGGRRVFVHELAHAWDRRSGHLLSRGIALLPGPRASAYAGRSRFEDWADAVMCAVYGAEPGFEAFAGTPGGRPSPRLRYVRWAFARYRGR
jgi:hypothetical protein